MKMTHTLPDGYREYYSVDLQKNKSMSLLVNGLSLLLALFVGAIGHLIVPLSSLFTDYYGFLGVYTRYICLLLSFVLYIILHEWVHGVAMKLVGTQKVKYGFTGLYAFAGSEDYYGKKPYIFIALAPVVFWGVVLVAVCYFVPTEWFWVFYLIQVVNLSGAAGDLFVTVKFSRFPQDILVRDYGLGMTVYSKEMK